MADRRAVPGATSRSEERIRTAGKWFPGRSDGGVGEIPRSTFDLVLRVDEVGAEFAFEQIEQGLFFGWWFRWPQIVLGGGKCRDMVLVNDSQCTPVLGAFVTVTFHHGSDGVGAAELLGELPQAGAGDPDPSTPVGSGEVVGGEGFEGFVHGGP